MKIAIANNYSDFLKIGRGAMLPSFRKAGDSRVLTSYVRWCPECDRKSVTPIDGNCGFSVKGNPFDLKSLTLNAALECPDCKWRGRIANGEYVEEGGSPC